MKINGSAAKTSFYLKRGFKNTPNWKLKFIFKCLSTEYVLNNYLDKYHLKADQPVAIFSKMQTKSFGQYGRKWNSPEGGIWFSTAYPIFSKEFSSEVFSISIASKICEMFLSASIKTKIKWPNDIFYGSKKLIGFLPKVITRGDEIVYVRIGLGMNLNNMAPREGISLCQILGKKNLCINYWSSKLLQIIFLAIKENHDKSKIISKANMFLDKKQIPREYESEGWSIKNIDRNGNLLIYKNDIEKVLRL